MQCIDCIQEVRSGMKSAYELAMERLEKASLSLSLTEDQKKEIAEVDSVYRAKIAEKELFLKDQIRKALAKFFHFRPMYFWTEMVLRVIAVVEEEPVINFSVAAHAPGNRLVGIRAIMPVIAVQIAEAVAEIPKREEIKNHITPVE